MKEKLKKMWNSLHRVKALKYILVTLFAVILIGFVDENSVWHHLQNKEQISALQDEIQKYTDEHQHNSAQIKMLDNNPKAIEKIARERYFMKEDGEDIFVLNDELEEEVNNEAAE